MKSVKIQSFFWPIFSSVWTEYQDLRRIFPYYRIRENKDQKKLHIWTFFTQFSLHQRLILEWNEKIYLTWLLIFFFWSFTFHNVFIIIVFLKSRSSVKFTRNVFIKVDKSDISLINYRNLDVYLEACQISDTELFCENN